jgi:hypothetical protein
MERGGKKDNSEIAILPPSDRNIEKPNISPRL